MIHKILLVERARNKIMVTGCIELQIADLKEVLDGFSFLETSGAADRRATSQAMHELLVGRYEILHYFSAREGRDLCA
jgi:hypothetical protein